MQISKLQKLVLKTKLPGATQQYVSLSVAAPEKAGARALVALACGDRHMSALVLARAAPAFPALLTPPSLVPPLSHPSLFPTDRGD